MKQKIMFNNGIEMPAIGLGVYNASIKETEAAVAAALEAGYRLIDTASIYGNEEGVGKAIAATTVPREEIFVTTKLWVTDFQEPRKGFEDSLRRLNLDYVDLYLLHWPCPATFDVTVAAYKELEKLQARGKICSIGVSNFEPAHLNKLMEEATVMPVLNQVERHPYLTQTELVAVNESLDIVTQAWSPIGGSFKNENSVEEQHELLADTAITNIADRHARSAAQIVLRWNVQGGHSAIPKSVTPSRIQSNIDIFDFSLTEDEMNIIDSLNKDLRGGPHPNDLGINA